MNSINAAKSSQKLDVRDSMEWNVLQVAIDDLIEHLEDLLVGELPDEKHIIEERFASALSLKSRLAIEPDNF